MTTMNSNERERLRRIQESDQEWRRNAPELGDVIAGLDSDVDFLISLLDSQATLARELAMIVDVGTSDDPGTALLKLHKIQESTATRMRDLCVEKVKGMKRSLTGVTDTKTEEAILRRNVTLAEVLIEIESLTLDQVEKKQ